jgi:hypothetical protein
MVLPVPAQNLHTIELPRSLTVPVPVHLPHLCSLGSEILLYIENRFPNAILISLHDASQSGMVHEDTRCRSTSHKWASPDSTKTKFNERVRPAICDQYPIVLQAVRKFNDFEKDNDPLRGHACFFFKLEGELYAADIAYCDRTLAYGFNDPSDPAKTTRVMAIMFASDM